MFENMFETKWLNSLNQVDKIFSQHIFLRFVGQHKPYCDHKLKTYNRCTKHKKKEIQAHYKRKSSTHNERKKMKEWTVKQTNKQKNTENK